MGSHRFIKIDDLIREDHFYLNDDDDCHYVMQYTSGQRYDFSDANSLIWNLKKSVDKNAPGWRYKGMAIDKISGILSGIINKEYWSKVTLVPIPPSKCKRDPLYDNRNTQVLTKLCKDIKSDIRELIILKDSIEPSHFSTSGRPTPLELERCLEIDETLTDPPPTTVLLFDDVITAGAHFKACKHILTKRFPGVCVRGVFIARRVFLATDDELQN